MGLLYDYQEWQTVLLFLDSTIYSIEIFTKRMKWCELQTTP